jgi:DNA polymerase III gamma/tau subunit
LYQLQFSLRREGVRVDITLKYRPKTWDGVLGQDATVKSLKAVLKNQTKRSFLFTGPSGIGKTTLARILAESVGCAPKNLLEIDAATHTGIDAMRAVTESMEYKALGDSPVKVVIVDEAHSLSKQAWQSLLKSVEEPPSHVYWIFCTTEPGKIPITIRTRCVSFQLQLVKVDVLVDLLESVVKSEGWKTPEDVLLVVAKQALGSPRQALSYLGAVYACRDAKAALPALQRAQEGGEAIDLARALVKGGLTWAKVVTLVEPLRDQSAEGIRLMVLAYLTTVALGTKTDSQAGRVLELMDAFGSEPYNASEGLAPLLLSLGRVVFTA